MQENKLEIFEEKIEKKVADKTIWKKEIKKLTK